MRRQASGVERASNETTNTFQRQQTTGGSWFVMRLNNGDIASPTTYLEREAFRIEDKYLQYIQVGTRSRECHTSEFRRSSAGWLNESLNQSIK